MSPRCFIKAEKRAQAIEKHDIIAEKFKNAIKTQAIIKAKK